MIGGMILSLLASIFLLSESKEVVNFEQQQMNSIQPDGKNMPLKEGEVVIESNSDNLKIEEVLPIFVKTSFMDKSLMVCCLAGLTINFLTAFAWGILTKWLKTWGNEPNWAPLPKAETAFIIFC